MNLEWQVCSIEQAEELHGLGIVNPSDLFVWFWSQKEMFQERGATRTKSLGIKSGNKDDKEEEIYVTNEILTGLFTFSSYNAFTLAEIAVMLGYTFCQTNVKEAAERLIEELKNGCVLAKDANARLNEIQNS